MKEIDSYPIYRIKDYLYVWSWVTLEDSLQDVSKEFAKRFVMPKPTNQLLKVKL